MTSFNEDFFKKSDMEATACLSDNYLFNQRMLYFMASKIITENRIGSG